MGSALRDCARYTAGMKLVLLPRRVCFTLIAKIGWSPMSRIWLLGGPGTSLGNLAS